jgi:hypothetical protein
VRSTAYQLKAARLPNYRDLAGFDFASSEVNEALARPLHLCEFLEDAHNASWLGDPERAKRTSPRQSGRRLSNIIASVSGSSPRSNSSMRSNRKSFRVNLDRSQDG